MVFYIVIRIFLRGIVDTGTREHGIRCKHSCLYTTNTLNNWKGRTFIFYTTPQKVGPLGRCKGISGQALGLPPQTIPNYCMTFSMDISHSSTWPRRQIPIRTTNTDPVRYILYHFDKSSLHIFKYLHSHPDLIPMILCFNFDSVIFLGFPQTHQAKHSLGTSKAPLRDAGVVLRHHGL